MEKAEYKGCKFFEQSIAQNVRVKVEFGQQTVKKLRKFLKENPNVEQIRVGFIMNFSIDETEGSWAYGKEWQHKAWIENPDCTIELRVQEQNGYDRVAIYMPLDDGKNFSYNALMRSKNTTYIQKRDVRSKVADFL